MKCLGTVFVALTMIGALPLPAQNTKVAWWSLGSGASVSSAEQTVLSNSVGQAIAGSASGGNFRIIGGFLANPIIGGSVSEVKRTDRIPLVFSLLQNYPNPFNPSTTITFELPKKSVVTLTVFDMLGREVSVLVNERKDGGVHEVRFDGSNVASGVYVYRLQADDFVQSRKLLLLK